MHNSSAISHHFNLKVVVLFSSELTHVQDMFTSQCLRSYIFCLVRCVQNGLSHLNRTKLIVDVFTQERLALLHKISEEHQTFQGCVKRFQSWLLTETKRLTTLMERDDTAENKLAALQVRGHHC